MTPEMQRAWVAEWPGDKGQPLGLVSLCMRFNQDATGPYMTVREFPRSREDLTLEKHVTFGLLDERDLPLLRDAIDKYLEGRRLDDLAEHAKPDGSGP
jgi:hypothetical protein